MFILLPCLIIAPPPPPPPSPLHAAIHSLVLLFHGFGSSTISRPPPCARGDALHGGDPALVPGECIAAAMGSRSFGWLPWLPWQPMLTIEDDGEIIATRPDGTRVRRMSKQAIIINTVV